ncbi:hypothetical protein Emag_001143 [Eimeria magna]
MDSYRTLLINVLISSSQIRDSVASLPQPTQPLGLSSLPCGQAESLAIDDACTVAAAWANSLELLALLARHLRGCISAASPRATLRVLAGAVTLWRVLRSEGQGPRLSLHASVAAALSDAGAVEFSGPAASQGLREPPEVAGEWWAPPFDTGKPQCAWGKLLSACKAVSDGSKCNNEEKLEQETIEKQQEATCDGALRELLSATIPALSESSADLSLRDCVSFLELLWPLAVSPSFSLPFRWVEGLLFHLAAQAHCLSPPSLLALAAFAEACVARDGGEGSLLSLASGSEGSEELHVQRIEKQRQVQNEVVAGLLRRRIRQEIKRKGLELTSNEKRLFRCLLEASGNSSASIAHQQLDASSMF